MATYYDEELGRFVTEEEKEASQTPTAYEQSQKSLGDLAAEQRERTAEEKVDPFAVEEPKPVIAEGPGQALGEVARITANAGTALVTDYGDLASYLGDAVNEVGNLATGKGFNPEGKFLNDSDNPWTQWRMNTFEPETHPAKGGSQVRLDAAEIPWQGTCCWQRCYQAGQHCH